MLQPFQANGTKGVSIAWSKYGGIVAASEPWRIKAMQLGNYGYMFT